MTDKPSTPSWGEQWFGLQQNYWDAWTKLQGSGDASGGQGSGSAPNPWAAGLDNWWKMVSGNAPTDQRAMFDRLLEQARSYFGFAEQCVQFTHGMEAYTKAAEQWRDGVQNHFADFGKVFTQAQAEAGKHASGLSAFSSLPLDTWMRTLSTACLMPGDALKEAKGFTGSPFVDQWHQTYDQFLSVPTIGYTREWQEQQQRGAQLWVDYLLANQEYLQSFNKLADSTLEQFKTRLGDRYDKGETISSLREAYDVWVDAGEAAFADFAFSDEYSRAYGHMVNSLMAIKRHARQTVDETLGALGMPTRDEMNSMQRALSELRREIHTLRSQIAAAPRIDAAVTVASPAAARPGNGASGNAAKSRAPAKPAPAPTAASPTRKPATPTPSKAKR